MKEGFQFVSNLRKGYFSNHKIHQTKKTTSTLASLIDLKIERERKEMNISFFQNNKAKKVEKKSSEMDELVKSCQKLIGEVNWKLREAWNDNWDKDKVGCLYLNGR